MGWLHGSFTGKVISHKYVHNFWREGRKLWCYQEPVDSHIHILQDDTDLHASWVFVWVWIFSWIYWLYSCIYLFFSFDVRFKVSLTLSRYSLPQIEKHLWVTNYFINMYMKQYIVLYKYSIKVTFWYDVVVCCNSLIW